VTPRRLEQLQRLQTLRASGALSDEEFEQQKDRLLNRKLWPIVAGISSLAAVIAVGAYVGLDIDTGMKPSSAATKPLSNGAAPNTRPSLDTKLSFGSHIAGASLVGIAELPPVPSHAADNADCTDCFVVPKTAGGQVAAAKGWHVVQEAKLGDLDAVLIVSHMEQQTSGRVEPEDANVALFDGAKLVGILFGKGKQGIEIAKLEPAGGELRVWSAIPESLQGRLHVRGTAISFDRVTGSDAVCNGAYRVPAVFNDSYSQARSALTKAGWIPLPQVREPDTIEPDTPEARYAETDDCAGTGFAQCIFDYKAAKGSARLNITTHGEGEDPIVSTYAVTCDPPTH
jgi:hypothetical protein